jgi:DNA-binding response OmpR family regulator
MKGIVASFEVVANRNEIDLTFQSSEENVMLYFDAEKLEEILFNLLSNAIKFTPRGGKITAALERIPPGLDKSNQGWLAISISDSGPGIPRDQLAHIFDRFYQADNTYEHHRKGTGIGLAIAKELVEIHHGSIDVHSSEGQGAEFTIRLPLGKAHLQPDEIIEMAAAHTLRKPQAEIPELFDEEEEVAEAGESAAAPGEEGKDGAADEEIDLLKQGREIILVVEDSADVRDYVRGALETEYQVIEAADGREGIQKAQEIIPDLVISDIMMPGIDGYELCRQLKNDVATSHIPIILLTARASDENIIQGLETGADDYITKPFNTRILMARIKNLIDLRTNMQKTVNREMTLQPVNIAVSHIDKKFIKKLQQVIDENISDTDFNIERLCKKMELSQPTLYRKIQALSGESPTEFIRSYRLKRGAELLKNNFGSVLEVALEVGFSSANYFTKCFKKKYHRLPSTFMETG